tara:strand:+ start:108 stop:752 length:645 start_codon:yes stop_codon:yes gene_type:complete
MSKTTVLFEAGTYGQFLIKVLNLCVLTEQTHFLLPGIIYVNTTPKRADHHLIDDNELDSHVTKITFEDSDSDLINRNKWTKLPEHLDEQANLTFPKDPNSKLYTIACSKINLLDPKNFFKKIKKESNFEFKFKYFHYDITNYTIQVDNLFSKLKIQVAKNYLENSKKTFDKSQESIKKAHDIKNDLIHEGNQLGALYFQKFGNNIQKENFQKLI